MSIRVEYMCVYLNYTRSSDRPARITLLRPEKTPWAEALDLACTPPSTLVPSTCAFSYNRRQNLPRPTKTAETDTKSAGVGPQTAHRSTSASAPASAICDRPRPILGIPHATLCLLRPIGSGSAGFAVGYTQNHRIHSLWANFIGKYSIKHPTPWFWLPLVLPPFFDVLLYVSLWFYGVL